MKANNRTLTPDEIKLAIAAYVSEVATPDQCVSPDDVTIYIGHHFDESADEDGVVTYLSGASVLIKER